MKYLLFYEKGPGYAERQTAPLQEGHKRVLTAAVDSGALLLAGSLDDPDDGSALLVFEADSPATVEEFARKDPYVVDGVVTRWYVRRWMVAFGTLA